VSNRARNAFLEVCTTTRADDGRLNGGICENPGHCELTHGRSALIGEPLQCGNHIQILAERRFGENSTLRSPVIRRERGAFIESTPEQAMSERAICESADIVRRGVRRNVSLDITPEQVVWRLGRLDRPNGGEFAQLGDA
jgi:hypothetical protein